METKPLLIGGKWRATSNRQEVRSPFDGATLALVSYASRDEVEEAIAVASSTAASMRALPRYEVAEALRRLADYIEAHREDFARTIATEAGKPINAARGETDRAVSASPPTPFAARREWGER